MVYTKMLTWVTTEVGLKDCEILFCFVWGFLLHELLLSGLLFISSPFFHTNKCTKNCTILEP